MPKYGWAGCTDKVKGFHRTMPTLQSGIARRLNREMRMPRSSLVMMYLNGQGVPRDDIEAVKWYRKAAEQGNAVCPEQSGSDVRKR